MQSARGHCFPSFNPKAFPDVLSLQLPPKSYGAASYREDKSFWYAHMFSRGSKVSGTQLPNNYWSASAHSLSFFVKTLNRALGSKKVASSHSKLRLLWVGGTDGIDIRIQCRLVACPAPQPMPARKPLETGWAC